MKANIKIERWEFPIFKVEPEGLEYIQVSIREPSQVVDIKATIPLKDAKELGNRLIALVENFERA